MTVLGVDYGRSHVGLALGDTATHLALPLQTLTSLAKGKLTAALREIVLAHGIARVVVGLPLALTVPAGRSGMHAEVEAFAASLYDSLGLPVELVDERLTSKAARQLRRSGEAADEHALAAMLILQTYLDRIRRDHGDH